jgi:hypothetical protein
VTNQTSKAIKRISLSAFPVATAQAAHPPNGESSHYRQNVTPCGVIASPLNDATDPR